MSSKFVEILDSAETPFSHDNVILEDILADKRHRSPSTASDSSLAGSVPSSNRGTAASAERDSSTRRRRFSLKRIMT